MCKRTRKNNELWHDMRNRKHFEGTPHKTGWYDALVIEYNNTNGERCIVEKKIKFDGRDGVWSWVGYPESAVLAWRANKA